MRNRIRSRLLALVALTSIFVSYAKADSLRDAFDYYKSNPSGTYTTKDMQGWVGPSFQARNKITSPKVATFQPPSVAAGCGGIDFFSGSFSIITKDEIVQMARGIAQGAPGYFFNLAIDSVCAGCGAQMRELQRKLESFNQITQDACNRAWDLATDPLYPLEERTKNKASSLGGMLDSFVGIVPDYGDIVTNSSTQKEISPNGRSVSESNLIVDIAKEKVATAVSFTDMNPIEIMASLYGTVVISYADSTGPTDDQSAPKLDSQIKLLSLEKLVYNPLEATPDPTLDVYKCQPDPSDPTNTCYSLTPSTITFPGLVASYKDHLMSMDPACLGIIPAFKTGVKNLAAICATRKDFFLNNRFAYQSIAAEFEMAQAHVIADHFALLIAKNSLTDFYEKQKEVLLTAIAPGNKMPGATSPDDVKRLIEIADQDYKSTMLKIDSEINDSLKNIQVQHSLLTLHSMAKYL